VFLLPLATAGITTFYMFRMWFMTFTGPPRDHHVYDNAHESPWVMTVPLIVLAVCSVGVAWNWTLAEPARFFLDSAPEHEIHDSQPASVMAEFGVLPEEVDSWKGGPAKESSQSERVVAHENHAFAGNLALGVVALGLVF